MKRGGPLKRTGWLRSKVRLRSKSPLHRYTPLHSKEEPKPAAKPRRAVPADVRALVEARSEGMCEVGSDGCWGKAAAVHHRVLRKSGGRCGEAAAESDRASNLIAVCVPCHEWAHENRWIAGFHGWVLAEWRDPARRSVLLLRHDELPVFLDDVGKWHRYDEAGT